MKFEFHISHEQNIVFKDVKSILTSGVIQKQAVSHILPPLTWPITDSQSEVSTASASSGNVLERQIFLPHPGSSESETLGLQPSRLRPNKLSRWFWYILKVENYCPLNKFKSLLQKQASTLHLKLFLISSKIPKWLVNSCWLHFLGIIYHVFIKWE